MIKTHILIICFFFSSFAETSDTLSSDSGKTVLTEKAETDTSAPEPDADPGLRKVENTAWSKNEELVFKIGWGIINAGTAKINVGGPVRKNGRKSLTITSAVQSNSFFDKLYKVRDTIISFIDKEACFSHGIIKIMNEGDYQAKRSGKVDYKNWAATAIDHKKNKKQSFSVPPYIQDIMSALFFVRTRELRKGNDIFIMTFDDEKVYPLRVIVHGKDRIKTDAGKFDCWVVEPRPKSSGAFKSKGKLTVWLTDDQYLMPVLMKSKIPVGSVKAELISFSR